MTEQEFCQIQARVSTFTHTSLSYTEWDEVSHFEILSNTERLILLYGYDAEAGVYVYHFAADQAEHLAAALTRRNANEKLMFVPEDWVLHMEAQGFRLHAVWNDYFATDLTAFAVYEAPSLLTPGDAASASRVTLSCRDQSRGFTGQSADWMRMWMSGQEPACPSYTDDTAVLGAWHGGDLVGVVCVGIYGEPEKRTLWIREIAVLPDAQGKGVARRLIGQAFAYGLRRHAKKAFLMADAMNAHAIRAYTGMGFVCRPEDAQIDMLRP